VWDRAPAALLMLDLYDHLKQLTGFKGAKMKSLAKLVAAAAMVLSFAGAANANLVVNGGFETSNLTGWSGTPGSVTSIPDYVHSGIYGLAFGAVGFNAPISQTLTTVAGVTYEIDFWYNINAGTPNAVTMSFDGVQLFNGTNLPIGDWTHVSFTATATSSSTVLLFGLRQDPAFSGLDDISVNAVAAVPEPATWAMMILGFAGVGFMAYRRSRKDNGLALAAA
jgi:hypothetical protein